MSKTRPAQQNDKGIMKPEYTPSYLTCHQYVRFSAFKVSVIKPAQALSDFSTFPMVTVDQHKKWI